MSVKGCEIAEAENGLAAWNLLQTGTAPDLCILDHKMPVMDGMALLSRIRSDARLSTLAVIMCTSSGESEWVTKAADLQANSYIVKPYQAHLVIEQVERLRQSLASSQTLEDAVSVCERLGIDGETYHHSLQLLEDELGTKLASIRDCLATGLLSEAVMQAHALADSCANLGAKTMAARLSHYEQILAQATKNTPEPSPERRKEWTAALEALDAERQLIVTAVAAQLKG